MYDIPDAELLERFTRTESEAAFAELVRRHLNLVHSVALRHTDNPQHAQEITQAVFIILARKAASLGRRTVLSGWLYHTARLTAANFRRAEFRRVRREQEAFMQSTLEEPAPDTVWRELAPMLDEAMARLGATDRDAVVLRYFENKSLVEVGAVLDVKERAAQKRVTRALEKLRRFFTGRGVTLSATVIAGAVSANSVQAAPVGLAVTVTAAAAKGAAVGGSTLTIIKGALKIMAWTKAKTAIVVGASVLLAAGTATVIVKEARNHFEENDAVWNDDRSALDAAPPIVILRPTKFPQSRAGGILLPENGKLAIRCQPANMLLIHAFNCSQVRMVLDAPLPDGFFDYLVTLPKKQKEALQQKIREQLDIVGHREMRDTAVYIVRGQRAPELKPVSAKFVEQVVENGHYKGRMSDMWYSLECYLKTPVLAETDPSSDCQVDLRWGNPTDKAFPAIPDVAALQKAIREQLGLDMIATNRPIEMLVVEKVK